MIFFISRFDLSVAETSRPIEQIFLPNGKDLQAITFDCVAIKQRAISSLMKSKRPYGMPPPYSPRFDFDKFIQGIKGLEWPEMIFKAEAASANAARVSYEIKGAVANREQGSVEFSKRLNDLLYFLKQGQIPTGGKYDKAIYKEFAEILVAKGQWKTSALEMFTEPRE